MSDNSAICAGFPQTRKEYPAYLHSPTVAHHQQSVARIAAWALHVEFLACAKVFAEYGDKIEYRDLFGPDRHQCLMRPRRWCWWILKNHPDLNISWPVIADRYNRHHSTVLNSTRIFHLQMLAGYLGKEMAAVQWICDALTEQGFTPATVSEVGV